MVVTMGSMKGLSGKEMEVVSFLELNEKLFFTRDDIKQFFVSGNEMGVYMHNMKRKGRIIKINRSKYFLVPVKAFSGHWSEHPFIVIDEIFNGKGYFVSGMAAAHYWGLIEQIPSTIEVRNTTRQGKRRIFDFDIIFRRQRSLDPRSCVRAEIKGHQFFIESRAEARKWLKTR
jgi:predicted transcriptional regulator of viral defense system